MNYFASLHEPAKHIAKAFKLRDARLNVQNQAEKQKQKIARKARAAKEQVKWAEHLDVPVGTVTQFQFENYENITTSARRWRKKHGHVFSCKRIGWTRAYEITRIA